MCDFRIIVTHGANETVQILVNQPVCADQFLDFFDRAAIGDQFRRCRHVDAVDVRITHRRRGGCKIDFAGAGVAGHPDDLA